MKFLSGRGPFAILLTIAVLLVYWTIFTSTRLPGGDLSDTVAQGYPFMSFTEESIRQGQLPHWNPYVFCGIPFYSSFSAPVFYPLRGLLLVAAGTEATIRFLFPLHMLLGGIFAWLFLGSIGTSRWGRTVGALAFAMTAWSNTLFYAGHGSKIICWSYFPLLLFSVERWMKTRRGLFLAVGGLSMGMMALSSHPQMVLYSAFAATIWAGFRAFSAGPRPLRWVGPALTGIVVIVLLAGAIGAVQLLPGYEFSTNSSRGSDLSLEQAASYSLPPEESLTMLFPHLFGYRHGFPGSTLSGVPLYFGRLGLRLSSEFVGVSVFLLAIAAWFSGSRKYRWPLLAIAATGLLVSWGGYTPVFGLLYRIVPVFRKLRAPHMAAFLTTSATALAAGPGFDALFAEGTGSRKGLFYRGFLIFAGICVLVFLLAGGLLSGLQSGWWRSVGIPGGSGYAGVVTRRVADASPDFLRAAVVAGILAALVRFRDRLKGGMVIPGLVLAVVAAAELIPVDRDFQVFLNVTDAEEVFDVPQGLSEQVGSGRLLPGGNEFVQSRIRSVSGYHAAKPAVIEDLEMVLGTGGAAAYRQTAYTVLQAEGSYLTYGQVREALLEQASADQDLLEMEGLLPAEPLPRAWFAGSWVVLEGDQALQAMSAGSDPLNICILSSDPGGLPAGDLDQGEAVITVDQAERVVIETDNPGTGLLVLADTYYPRWRVHIDGVETPLLQANHWQRAVVVPPGQHQVEFYFDSSDVRTGLIVSLIGLASVLVLVIIDLIRRRRRPA